MAGSSSDSNITVTTLIVALVCFLLLLLVIVGMLRPDLIRRLTGRRHFIYKNTAVADDTCCPNDQHCLACPLHQCTPTAAATVDVGSDTTDATAPSPVAAMGADTAVASAVNYGHSNGGATGTEVEMTPLMNGTVAAEKAAS